MKTFQQNFLISISKQFFFKTKSNTFKMSLLLLLNNKWFPVRRDSTNKWLVSNLFHLRWTKPKVNNYNSFIKTIKSTIITRLLGSYNINYYNLLIMTEYINNSCSLPFFEPLWGTLVEGFIWLYIMTLAAHQV